MNRKNLVLALAALILVAGGIGYVISQILWEHTITGTVTVVSQPSIYIFDEENKPVSTLDFGSLSNGVHLTRVIKLVNVGNTPLSITVERTDASAGISSLVKNQDGSVYDNVTPTVMGMGENLYLTLEIWNPASLPAGAYPLAFKVTGN